MAYNLQEAKVNRGGLKCAVLGIRRDQAAGNRFNVSMFSDLFLFFSFYHLCLTLPRDDVDGSDAVGLTGLKTLQLGTRYYGCTCSNKNLGAVNSPWAIIF